MGRRDMDTARTTQKNKEDKRASCGVSTKLQIVLLSGLGPEGGAMENFALQDIQSRFAAREVKMKGQRTIKVPVGVNTTPETSTHRFQW